MADAFDGLERGSFDGIEFPLSSYKIKGALRKHIHEFPHVGGGDPEKLGRKLYVFQLQIPAYTDIINYPDLWPNGLAALRSKWEKQETRNLVVPTLPGSVPAFAIDWEQDMDAKIRSGESVSVTYLEDRSADFVETKTIVYTRNSVEAANEEFALANRDIEPRPSLFDEIQEGANEVLALRDEANLYGSLVEAKIAGVIALIGEADSTLAQLQDPTNHAAFRAMLALWESLQKLAENVGLKEEELRTFVLPVEMATSEISLRLYRENDRATEIMQLNGIVDPFAVPAGTSIRYYADQEA